MSWVLLDRHNLYCLTLNTNAGISGQQILADDVGSSKRRRIDQMNTVGPSLTMHARPVLEVFSDADANANVLDLQVPEGAQHLRTDGVPSNYRSIGKCEHICEYCGALFWYEERLKSVGRNRRPKYGRCCKGGRVGLRTYQIYPEYIKLLLRDRHFMENIRAYNEMFSMTSLGAHIDEYVNNERGPYVFKIFGQLYHCDIRGDIVEGLIGMLDTHNALVHLFRTTREKLADTHIPNFKVRLYKVVGAREYELPTGDMLGVIVYEPGPETDMDYDIVIEERSGHPQHYVVTAFCAIEQNKKDYVREHQNDIRNEYLSGIYDAINKGDNDGSDCGARLTLPQSFIGGPRYMRSHYLDALAICRVHGNPSFFVTFTRNIKWMNSHLAESSQYYTLWNFKNEAFLIAACQASGLLEDDQEWENTIKEAACTATPAELRTLIAHILAFCQVTDPSTLWKRVWRSCLNHCSRSLIDFGMRLPPEDLMSVLKNRLLMEEKSYNRGLLTRENERLMGKWNGKQRRIFDLIKNACTNNQQELIFVYGHGGTGIAPVAIIDRQLPFEYTITRRSTDMVVMTHSIQNINHSDFRSMFEREKLSGNHFNYWFHQLMLVLRVEKKMFVIEQPIPPTPAADSEANVLVEWNALYDVHNEVACLMLGSMTPKLHRQFENYSPYEMLQELSSMFKKQAGVERFDLIQTFHACKQEKGKSVATYVLQMKGYVDQLECLGYVLPQDITIGELHAMLIEYEKALPEKAETPQVMMIKCGKIQKAKKKSLNAKGKANGKGKDKQVHIPEPKNPKPSAKEHPAKDDTCHHYKEVFKNKVENQLRKTIKALRLDQGEVEEHSLGDLNEPASYKAAMLDSKSNKWIDVMNAEIQSMIDNMVWVLVDLPHGCKTVGTKGYTQLYGVDYEETFSPVADIRAIRILISIAAFCDYEIW
nr:helitron helicase-like domain-containing protein [Tanacetum cinerariifolium]